MADSQELRTQQHNRYKYLIENIKDVVWELDTEYKFMFVGPNSKEMSGYEPEEMIGRQLTDFLSEESKKYVMEQAMSQMPRRLSGDTGEVLPYDVQFVRKDGSVIWVEISANPIFEDGAFVGYIGTTRNISDKKRCEYQLNQFIEGLKTANVKLEQIAVTDILTGAYNRRKFDDDLNFLILHHNAPFSLLFFDIDRFKAINDQFGHKTGDLVLQDISKLVLDNLRKTDRLYRWGGEEFIVILMGTGLEFARSCAERIRHSIEQEDFGIKRRVTISAGVSEYKAGEDADRLINRIDKILYGAKMKGGNRVLT